MLCSAALVYLSSTPIHNAFLEQPNRLAHRGLDMQRLDVLPVLLEQRNEEINAYAVSAMEFGTTYINSLSITFDSTWSSVIST